MARVVHLVAGPPCAGKSTHVRQHARPGDLILDQDDIGHTAMTAGLARVKTMTDGTAWVIRCAPGPTRREALAQQLRAEVLLLRPDDATLLDRAAHRPDPRRHIQAVRDWLHREAADTPGRTTRGAAPRLTTTQRGYGWEHQKARASALRVLGQVGTQSCPFCGEPMTRAMDLDYDHYPPLAHAYAGCRTRHATDVQDSASHSSAKPARLA
jgi:hypothetical protein